MDISISSIQDIGLQIQLTTLQLVVTSMAGAVAKRRQAIEELKNSPSFGSTYKIEILNRELVGVLECEAIAVDMFKTAAKNSGLGVKEEH